MKEELKKVIDETISHTTFLNKSDLFNAVEKSYNIGLNENQKKYEILKTAFEELLSLISEHKYPKTEKIEELKLRVGIL